MEWKFIFLLNLLGGLLFSYGFLSFYQMIRYPQQTSPWLFTVLLTIGLAILFTPKNLKN